VPHGPVCRDRARADAVTLRPGRGFSNSLLRDPDGLRLFVSQLFAQFGYSMALVALPWLVLSQGGSTGVAALSVTAILVPYVVLALFAGVIGDRFPRKRLLVSAYTWQAAAAIMIPVAALSGPVPLGLILTVSVLIGLGRVFVDAATFGAIAEIVKPAQFLEAQAALTVAFGAGIIAGPLLSGVLIGVAGGAAAIAGQAACLTCGAVVAFTISRSLSAAIVDRHAQTRARDAAWDGLALIWREPTLRLLTGVAFVWFALVQGTTQSGLVAYLRVEVVLDAQAVGLTMGLAGLAGVTGGLTVGALAERVGGAWLIAVGIVASGLAVVGLSGVHDRWTAVLVVALLFFSIQVLLTSLVGERQRRAPIHMQSLVGVTGRACSVLGSMAGGLMLSGLSTLVSLRTLYFSFGVAVIVMAAWAVPAIFRAIAAPASPAIAPQEAPAAVPAGGEGVTGTG